MGYISFRGVFTRLFFQLLIYLTGVVTNQNTGRMFAKFLLLFVALLWISASADSISEDTNHLWIGVKSQLKKIGHKFEGIFQKNKEVEHDENPNAPKAWAVLVAGSSGFYNYRHQVCSLRLI